MNKVFLIGNLTKDPEIATTSNNVKFCRFTLAVQRNRPKDSKKETDFLQVVVWRNQAENCAKYLKKGSKAAVFGSIQTRTYDGQDGKRYVTEISADEVQFLSTKSGESDDDDEIEFNDLNPVSESELPF